MKSEMTNAMRFRKLKKVFGYSIKNKDALLLVLTCRKDITVDLIEQRRGFEYLGDAVLSLTLSKIFCDSYPNSSAHLINDFKEPRASNRILSKVMDLSKLSDLVIIKTATAKTYKADIFEMLVALLFLELGYKKTEKIVKDVFEKYDKDILPLFIDQYKQPLLSKKQTSV